MNRKGICKNCGEDISNSSNSKEYCSKQCGVEYQNGPQEKISIKLITEKQFV
jgi:hypothetical protein